MTRATWTVVAVRRGRPGMGAREIDAIIRVVDGADPEHVQRVVCDETGESYDVAGIATIPAASHAQGLRVIILVAKAGEGEGLDAGMSLRWE
jgi:hypothetical protein